MTKRQMHLRGALGGLLFGLAAATAAQAEPRFALVVGVREYGANSLANPINDARLIKSALDAAGFKVTPLENPDIETLSDALDAFAEQVAKAGPDATVAFYFAGHGVQINGRDFLIPAKSTLLEDLHSEREFERGAIDAKSILKQLTGKNPGRILLILDACRKVVAFKQIDRARPDLGLARFSQDEGAPATVIAFAARPGGVASDGPGETNGYFAQALNQEIRVPGKRLSLVLEDVAGHVRRKTDGQQVPFIEWSPFAFTFIEAEASQSVAGVRVKGDDEPQTWAVADSLKTAAAYRIYAELYPDGPHIAEARRGLALAAQAKPPVAPLAQTDAAAALRSVTAKEWSLNARFTIATKVMGVTTVPALQKSVDGKDPKAQLIMGALKEYGLGGVAQDTRAARELFRLAAAQNEPGAIHALADFAYYGVDQTKDLGAAKTLYLQAADRGRGLSQTMVAQLSMGDKGQPKADQMTRVYLKKAADQGEMFAVCWLGAAYGAGTYGFPKSEKLGLELARRAADDGNYCGQVNLGNAYFYGAPGVPQDKARGMALFKEAAKSNMPVPQRIMAIFYRDGIEVPKDMPEAIRLFTDAARQGDRYSQELMGAYHRAGEGVPKDPRKAIDYFTQASAQGSAYAKHELGHAYYYGNLDVTQDQRRGAALFIESAELGYPAGMRSAGAAYEAGAGVEKDEKKAIDYYRSAAKLGDAYAQYRLGVMTAEGQGDLSPNLPGARKLIEAAAAQDYAPAKAWLAARPVT